jgi:stage V sporulation protein SpoVS
MLVNGSGGTQGLSTYGFTVISQNIKGITVPLAYHTESGHFLAIVKANDYVHVDLEHFAPVAVDESLDPDYMYVLLDDTVIATVEVTIEHENGTSETVSLNHKETYAD